MRFMFVNGERRLQQFAMGAVTNDLGEYRLYGLTPGQYYVSAVLRNMNFGGDTTIHQHITHANPARPTALEDQINGLHRQGAKGVARAVRRLARP